MSWGIQLNSGAIPSLEKPNKTLLYYVYTFVKLLGVLNAADPRVKITEALLSQHG